MNEIVIPMTLRISKSVEHSSAKVLLTTINEVRIIDKWYSELEKSEKEVFAKIMNTYGDEVIKCAKRI